MIWRRILAGVTLLLLWVVATWQLTAVDSPAAIAEAESLYRNRHYREAAAAARGAIRERPLDPAGLRVLGQSLNREQPGAGDDLLLLAGQLGWRDVHIQSWLLQQAAITGETDIAVQRMEAMLRTRRDQRPIFALLRSLARMPHGRDVIAAALAQRPLWRAAFFALPPDSPASQLDGMMALIDMLAETSAPVSSEEARATLSALSAQGRAEEAEALAGRLEGMVASPAAQSWN